MKSTRSIQYFLGVVVTFCFLVASANAQSRYKHLPRVKIQKQGSVSIHTEKETLPEIVTTPSIGKDDSPVIINDVSTEPVKEATMIFSSEEETAKIQTGLVKTHLSSSSPTMVEKIKFVHRHSFHKKLKKPETTNKTNMSIAVILLIVFYVLAAVFTVLAVIYALVIFNFTLFIVFLILAIVFGLAGSVISLLLRFGVIN